MLEFLNETMSSADELREVEQKMREAEPSQGLKNQVPPDDEIEWVVEQDMRTRWYNLILHKLKLLLFMLVFGIVAAIFAIGATESVLLGFLAFLVVGIGIPGGLFAWRYHVLKNTNIEYAGTTDQFLRYRDTPTETRTDSVPISRAKDASFRQDRWDKLLDTGDIHIQGLRGAGNLRIKNVPDADAVHRLVQRQIAETEQVDDVGGLQQGGIQQGVGRR